MAFFGLFKSKQEKDFEASLKGVNQMIFPLGESDISRDCQRIDILTNGKIPDSDLKGFVTGCKALVVISTSYDDEDFIRSNVARSKNRINEIEARDVYVYLAGESMVRANIARMVSDQGKSLSSDLIDYCDQLGKIWAKGTTQDKIVNGIGEFGLSANNPIPTVCVKGSDVYLSRLRLNGKAVEHKRLGSTKSEITEGNVDIYVISQNGSEVAKIYICPYHRKDSKIAPKGFTIGSKG
jgi:hypothetical protein